MVFVALAACSYDASFRDCAVRCAPDGSCPADLTCGNEGLCRDPSAATAACAPSCTGLAATCGPDGSDDCCSIATPIPGGTFYRSYDVASDAMFPDMSYPATVGPFLLDKYEVTVGRFRAFVAAGGGTQVSPPAAGAGAHATIPDSGWDPSWDADLAANASALGSALQCDATYATWTATPGANEDLPINCVTWYEALAFCAWDGGYLPTEAEWNYAAAGGAEQRAYPWSNPPGNLTIDCSYANYDAANGTYCVGSAGGVNRVGSESPKGDSLWGQSDLTGNAWEWALDWYRDPYLYSSCLNCADLSSEGARVIRGDSFGDDPDNRVAHRGFSIPGEREGAFGVRCARP